jgi:hypothetical protein
MDDQPEGRNGGIDDAGQPAQRLEQLQHATILTYLLASLDRTGEDARPPSTQKLLASDHGFG